MTTDHTPTPAELASATWFKSTRSGAQNECAEAADLGAFVGVRDSKAPGPILTFPATSFTAFIGAVKAHDLD